MSVLFSQNLIFGFIGGLGLFLFGMKIMSEGLQKVAGDRMRQILAALTNNRIIGTLVGLSVTAIIQSSSATTVMVVGFVNAGLMSLVQSIGVVLGANIGTTVTAQLIAFNISQVRPSGHRYRGRRKAFRTLPEVGLCRRNPAWVRHPFLRAFDHEGDL